MLIKCVRASYVQFINRTTYYPAGYEEILGNLPGVHVQEGLQLTLIYLLY